MKKVLVIATSPYTRGGITSVISAHSQGDQWIKYHCRWLVTHKDGNAFVKVFYFISAFLKAILIIPFFDIVHIHFSEPPSAIRKSLFLALSTIYRKKRIVHFHSFSVETTVKGRFAKVYNYIFSHADSVIVLSNYWKQVVDKEYNLGEKIKVIYNPCLTTKYETQCKKENTILYAGTLNQRKGYADLIAAFSRIAKSHTEWNVVFAGNGEIEKGRKLANDLGIEKQVHFLGWVNGEQKNAAFQKASVFCLPSYAEGFPMAVLDAWAYGLPVITTPVGGIPDIAKDGENLLLFNPGDVDKLSKCLETLINSEVIIEKLSRESLRLSQTTFNIDTINKQIGELYASLCEAK